jgi:hypothetical protein
MASCDLCFFREKKNLLSLLKVYQDQRHRVGWHILIDNRNGNKVANSANGKSAE